METIKLDQLLRDYQRDGVVRIRRFFSTEAIEEIRAELDRYIRDDLPSKPRDARTVEADGTSIRNLWRLQEHNEFLRNVARHPEITDLVARLVHGAPVLAGVETFNKPPRVGSGVPPHQDNAYFCQTPPDMLTVWIAIDAVTAENGPVCFLKGSHQRGMLPTKPSGVTGNSIGLADPPAVPAAQWFQATLAPGDATIHHCQTIHRSAPNGTDQPRLGLLLVYRGQHTRTDGRLEAAYTEAVRATPPA